MTAVPPPTLLFVDGSCLTRATWDAAWRLLVTMHVNDPLLRPDAELLMDELTRGPWGPVMAAAA